LILGAEEVDRGRPAPVTIGNTTFFPQVRRAGELYGGFTRVNGDLEILHGDLYLGGQAVGATLQQHESSLNSLSVGAAQAQQSIQQLNQSVTTLDQTTQQQSTLLQQHGTALQNHQGSLNSLSVGAAQAQQSIQQLNQSVTTLDQTTQQQSTLLQQHGTALTQQSAALLQQGAAITGLSAEMQDVKQSITVLDQNLNSLGNGVAGATALASALASLPVDAVQSPLSCGVGSGGYSDRYALAMGCAVHLASSLSLNAGGAYLFGGSSSYGGGSLSDVAGRFGLTYRFGARDQQPTRTAQAQRKLEQDLKAVKDENRALQSMLMALQRRVDLLHAAAAKP
jgi:chromosome segregation ATPase